MEGQCLPSGKKGKRSHMDPKKECLPSGKKGKRSHMDPKKECLPSGKKRKRSHMKPEKGFVSKEWKANRKMCKEQEKNAIEINKNFRGSAYIVQNGEVLCEYSGGYQLQNGN